MSNSKTGIQSRVRNNNGEFHHKRSDTKIGTLRQVYGGRTVSYRNDVKLGTVLKASTRDFKEIVQERALRDKDFREGILRESIECLLSGDIKTGKALLRDYINATVGFDKLSRLTKKDSKSLMRMFSLNGNPTANNIFNVIHILQEKEGVHYELQIVK